MKNGTFFIQPHSDDIVMSAYFLIKKGFFPKPYFLITAFSSSNWVDPLKKKTRNLPSDSYKITKIRVDEDKKFAEFLDIDKVIFFNLKDCLLRNGLTYFEEKRKLDSKTILELRKKFNKLINEFNPKFLVAPFPCGKVQHYDHRLVVKSLQSLSQNKKFKLCFLDDLPYGRVFNLKKNNLSLFYKEKVRNMVEKEQAMKLYDSQMCRLYFSKVKNISKLNNYTERTFILKEKN